MSVMFRSFSSFNYRVWFIGALVSNIGAWMQATALSWVVLTQLTDNDATAMGITMALQFAPPLLLAELEMTTRPRRAALIAPRPLTGPRGHTPRPFPELSRKVGTDRATPPARRKFRRRRGPGGPGTPVVRPRPGGSRCPAMPSWPAACSSWRPVSIRTGSSRSCACSAR